MNVSVDDGKSILGVDVVVRFLSRMMIIPEENGGEQGVLAKHAKKIFLSSKPAPVLESKFKDSDQFQLGTLSHIIGEQMGVCC